MLGIDTGGTYTDAVLLDDSLTPATAVIASAKALTTRHDLNIGIAAAVARVFAKHPDAARQIALVSLSTTLATNAVVEQQGGRIGLVLVGLGEQALDRAGLKSALGEDPYLTIVGGHNAHGAPHCDVDLDSVERWLDEAGSSVTGFAVASEFAVRNRDHELAVRDLIVRKTNQAVTCSHELSSKLDAPRRALTSVLNARLIGLIHELIASTRALMVARNIKAPLMVVRGDGGLIAADIASTCPVETILSGPAASLVGAAWLTGEKNAVVSDIGGTTTDVAILNDGMPRLDPAGASVGGWRTMVKAVAMWTVGLGGDSEVRLKHDGLDAKLTLGPRRAIPISLLAQDYPDLVIGTLKRQAKKARIDERAGIFVLQVRDPGKHSEGLRDVERHLMSELAEGPVALEKLITVRMQLGALEKLINRGLVMVSSLTPSDAALVLGIYNAWNLEAASLAAENFAGRRNTKGNPIAHDGIALAKQVIETLTERSVETVLAAAFSEDGFDARLSADHPLVTAGLHRHHRTVKLNAGLGLPLIGLGASAQTYYPSVAQNLQTLAIIPDHAEVANAIGAIVGNVRITAQAVISQPEPGRYRVHMSGDVATFDTLEKANSHAEIRLGAEVETRARAAGAASTIITFDNRVKMIDADGQEIFVEAELIAEATGRPAFSITHR